MEFGLPSRPRPRNLNKYHNDFNQLKPSLYKCKQEGKCWKVIWHRDPHDEISV